MKGLRWVFGVVTGIYISWQGQQLRESASVEKDYWLGIDRRLVFLLHIV